MAVLLGTIIITCVIKTYVTSVTLSSCMIYVGLSCLIRKMKELYCMTLILWFPSEKEKKVALDIQKLI